MGRAATTTKDEPVIRHYSPRRPTVRAAQWRPSMGEQPTLGVVLGTGSFRDRYVFSTPAGYQVVNPGDWVVEQPDGVKFLLPDAEFRRRFELVVVE